MLKQSYTCVPQLNVIVNSRDIYTKLDMFLGLGWWLLLVHTYFQLETHGFEYQMDTLQKDVNSLAVQR